MIIFIAIILTIIAGTLIGVYAIPIRYISMPTECTWLLFSILAYFILPYLAISLFAHSYIVPLNIISIIPKNILLFLLIGGIIWGIGQVLFSIGFKFIGFGLNFVINISIGTAGTALIPLLAHFNTIKPLYAILQFLGIIIFVIAIVVGTVAGKLRNNRKSKNDQISHNSQKLTLGVIFAIIAGIGSVFEGISYVFGNPIVSSVSTTHGMYGLGANIVAWAIVFFGAGIPFFIYFLILSVTNKSLKQLVIQKFHISLILTIIMSICYFFPLIIFSLSSLLIGGSLAPTIAWPLFMVFIILSSNIFSFISGEWKNAEKKAILTMKMSMIFFVIAVIVFSLSSFTL